MRAFVLHDRALEGLAGRFVWLEIDTENAVNAPFLERFALDGVPTLYVIDSRTETVLVRWLGSLTAVQLAGLLEGAERTYLGNRDELLQALGHADQLFGSGQAAEAASAYQALLARAAAEWPVRERVTGSLVLALQAGGQDKACATTAREAYARFKDSASALSLAAAGLDCALGLPAGDPDRSGLLLVLEGETREAIADPKVPAAIDDRSDAYRLLVAARQDAHDGAGARAAAADWAQLLESAAAQAETPSARAVFDAHRLAAYLALGQPERALPMLAASERDFPNDFNPPARLALAFAALKRYEEALAASDRALARVRGPRRITILRARAEILDSKGDHPAALRVLGEALALAESLPAGQRSPRTIAALRQQLGK